MSVGKGSAGSTTWAAGDYPAMARRIEPVAGRALAFAGLSETDTVVDIACGTGNGALAASRIASRVLGTDFEPSLLSIAANRDTARRVRWQVDDATAPFEATYSLVLTLFGAMYVPDHDAAARALAAACSCGGRVVSSAWVPGGLLPSLGPALAPYLPSPPPGTGPPSAWGDADAVAALLARHGLQVEDTVAETLWLDFPSPDHATRFFIDTAGHVIGERPRLERESRWNQLIADVDAAVGEHLRPRAGGVGAALDYLLVRATPR